MPKALVPYDGRLLVQRAADTLREAGIARRVIVLGAQAEKVRAAARLAGSEIVLNTSWESGMGSSLRAGLRFLAGTPAEAVVVLLVDMPGVTPEAVRRVAAAAAPDALAMGGYGPRRGHPVLLGRAHWPGVIEAATGDRGARDYLRANAALLQIIPVDDVADDEDLDVPPVESGRHA